MSTSFLSDAERFGQSPGWKVMQANPDLYVKPDTMPMLSGGVRMVFKHPKKWTNEERDAIIKLVDLGDKGLLPISQRLRFEDPPTVPELPLADQKKSSGTSAVPTAAPIAVPTSSLPIRQQSQVRWKVLSVSVPPFMEGDNNLQPNYNVVLVGQIPSCS